MYIAGHVLLKQFLQVSLIAVTLHSCLQAGDEDQLVSLPCTHNLHYNAITSLNHGPWAIGQHVAFWSSR